jgi:ribosomal protein S18 acetylase RimI-like enzyme
MQKDNTVTIRPYQADDWQAVWAILEPVFRAADTYAMRADISAEDAKSAWTADPKIVFVAVDDASGRLLGSYYLRPNFDGPAAHVCNCGYVVAQHARGRGIAAAMCGHSQDEAQHRGYRAMQFNLVVSTNATAVELWTRMGFVIVGTIPEAFRHPRFGFVDAYVMYKALTAPSVTKLMAAPAAPLDI